MTLHKYILYLIVFVCGSTFLSATYGGTSLLVEAEQFQFFGSWTVSVSGTALGEKSLAIANAKSGDLPAMTAVNVPQEGSYHVWARSMDYSEDKPGTRRYKLLIDGVAFDKPVGGHCRQGYHWEKIGRVQLTKGEHLIAIADLNESYARCDTVLLTTDNVDPGSLTAEHLKAYRVKPVAKKADSPFAGYKDKYEGLKLKTALGKLQNDNIKVSFIRGVNGKGEKLIHPEFQVKQNEKWVKVNTNPADQKLFLLTDETVKVKMPLGRPNWHGAKDQNSYIEVAGNKYPVSSQGKDPFMAATAICLYPTDFKKIDADIGELTYKSDEGQKVSTRWSLNKYDVKVVCDFIPAKSAFYSLGYCAFDEKTRQEISYVQMPPLYQFQRLDDSPNMIISDIMPHTLAMVEVPSDNHTDSKISFAAVAEPSEIPFAWSINTKLHATYGFSLINADNEIQPCIFSPVLGTKHSRWNSGEKHTVSFRLLVYPGDWGETLKAASDTVMEVKDYRYPIKGSLTDAVFNMIDLMKDDVASGWDNNLNSFYNIEMPSGVTNAAPLAVVSAALISGDEELYKTRALPTIGFTLSRPFAHFGRLGEMGDWSNKPKKESESTPTKLKVPTAFYSTPYWEGLYNLFEGLNPWIEKFILPGGKPYHVAPYNKDCPYWSSMMGQYRYQPSNELLAEIEKEASEFIEEKINTRQETPIYFEKFYNISFYPYWWDLLDLYEITGKKKYLRAAEIGGYHTIAGTWSNPSIPAGNVTIHKDNKVYGDSRVLFRGPDYYRLGVDPADYEITSGNRHWVDHFTAPEKKVPGWEISRMGLGMEQPSTYFPYLWLRHNQGMRNILMSIAAPNLLRLYHHSDNDIFKTYARNMVIGRYTNYPGYYYMGYTDLPGKPDFPYTGPDSSRIYYHHIPVHLGFTIDYLMTQAFTRSAGKIVFPWVKQQDYAWFVSRIYGFESGEIYGNKGAELFLDRSIVNIDDFMIDWFTARDDDYIYVVAMNQSDEQASLSPQYDSVKIGLDSLRPFKAYRDDSKRAQRIGKTDLANVKISPKGLTVLCLPVKSKKAAPEIAPLKYNGHVVYDLGEEFGDKLHVFRIRSQFGKDAIYAVILGGGRGDAFSVEFQLSGKQKTSKEKFPYEAIFYPVPMNKDVSGKVEIRNRKTGAQKQIRITIGK